MKPIMTDLGSDANLPVGGIPPKGEGGLIVRSPETIGCGLFLKSNESTEAVLDLCLKMQHENTKTAIRKRLVMQYDPEVCDELIMTEIYKIEQWIKELKLEDTK